VPLISGLGAFMGGGQRAFRLRPGGIGAHPGIPPGGLALGHLAGGGVEVPGPVGAVGVVRVRGHARHRNHLCARSTAPLPETGPHSAPMITRTSETSPRTTVDTVSVTTPSTDGAMLPRSIPRNCRR